MLCSESELNLSDERDGIIELNSKEKEIGKVTLKVNQKKQSILQLHQIDQIVWV